MRRRAIWTMCQNLPNKHDHLHKEYKYRNGAFRWVSKPDGFDSVHGLSVSLAALGRSIGP
jgi:hypothetical protein